MILLLAIAVLTLSAVLARGGSFRRLASLRIQHEGVLLVLFVLQAIARGRLLWPLATRLKWSPVAPWLFVSFALLVVLLRNRRVVGMPLAAIGVALNMLVVALNGSMPVAVRTASDATTVALAADPFYSLAADRTALLGDALMTPTYGEIGSPFLASAGDILLVLGAVIVVVWAAGSRRGA